MQRETTFSRCYGKPAPQIFSAVYLNGHYKDPRSVIPKVKGIASVALSVVIIALALFLL